MIRTSGRLLALLGLLQSGQRWSGGDLANRLQIAERTVRADIERLRELGYPITSLRGPAGGYLLGDRGRLPPLLLDDDEAVAVAVGLGEVTSMPGLADDAAQALTKLEQVLPDRLRRRVRAVHDTTELGPANTATNVAEPAVSATALGDLAAAIRDHQGLRFFYRDDRHRVEADPYRLVGWQQRWYLVARRSPTGEWQAFRVDWMTLRTPGGPRFTPAAMDREAYAAFVLRDVASTGWAVHARILIDAPAAEVLARINPAVGIVETVGDQRSVLVTGADSLEMVAVWIGMLGMDFHVSEPPELVHHLRTLSERYARATLPRDAEDGAGHAVGSPAL